MTVAMLKQTAPITHNEAADSKLYVMLFWFHCCISSSWNLIHTNTPKLCTIAPETCRRWRWFFPLGSGTLCSFWWVHHTPNKCNNSWHCAAGDRWTTAVFSLGPLGNRTGIMSGGLIGLREIGKPQLGSPSVSRWQRWPAQWPMFANQAWIDLI